MRLLCRLLKELPRVVHGIADNADRETVVHSPQLFLTRNLVAGPVNHAQWHAHGLAGVVEDPLVGNAQQSIQNRGIRFPDLIKERYLSLRQQAGGLPVEHGPPNHQL